MPNANNNQNEPIQPISFSKLLWLFFDAVIRFVKHSIVFLYKNKVLLTLFLVVGIIAGIVVNRLTRPTYSLAMLVKHTELTSRAFGQMLQQINNLASTGSTMELAKALNTSERNSQAIASISGESLDGTNLIDDTVQQTNRPFIIELVVKDNKLADTIQNALIYYFNSNPYLKKLKSDQIQLKQERIAFLTSELQKLDSLKTVYNSFLSSGKSSMFYNNAFNPVDIYKQSSAYYEEKNTIQEWLRQNNNSIVKIDQAKPTEVPQSMSLFNFALLYGAVFFMLGCLFAAIKAVIENSKF